MEAGGKLPNLEHRADHLDHGFVRQRLERKDTRQVSWAPEPLEWPGACDEGSPPGREKEKPPPYEAVIFLDLWGKTLQDPSPETGKEGWHLEETHRCRKAPGPGPLHRREYFRAVADGNLWVHDQKCEDCGALRHPPRPVCGECMSMKWGSVGTSGEGTVHSYVVMHHPPIPGYEMPLAVGLIDLAEGTRVVANVEGCRPDEVTVGMKVECRIEEVDDGGFKLPVFYKVD